MGFTLVEMMVAIAILLLILAICSALTFSAQNLLSSGMERMDADSQARLFFDRISVDLESMVKRPDVDYIVKDATHLESGNDSLAFYAKASGYFTTSPDSAPRKELSLLAYRVNSQTWQLERLARGIGWNGNSSGTPMVFLPSTLAGTWPAIAGQSGGVTDLNLGTDPAYQVLSDGVFRFEYCYILQDGTVSNLPYIKTHTALNGWEDVSAVYVAIAVLDDRSRLMAKSAGTTTPNLAAATSALGDFNVGTGAVYPPVAQWEAVVDGANFPAQVNLPKRAALSVRVFARSIPINPLPSDSSL